MKTIIQKPIIQNSIIQTERGTAIYFWKGFRSLLQSHAV